MSRDHHLSGATDITSWPCPGMMTSHQHDTFIHRSLGTRNAASSHPALGRRRRQRQRHLRPWSVPYIERAHYFADTLHEDKTTFPTGIDSELHPNLGWPLKEGTHPPTLTRSALSYSASTLLGPGIGTTVACQSSVKPRAAASHMPHPSWEIASVWRF